MSSTNRINKRRKTKVYYNFKRFFFTQDRNSFCFVWALKHFPLPFYLRCTSDLTVEKNRTNVPTRGVARRLLPATAWKVTPERILARSPTRAQIPNARKGSRLPGIFRNTLELIPVCRLQKVGLFSFLAITYWQEVEGRKYLRRCLKYQNACVWNDCWRCIKMQKNLISWENVHDAHDSVCFNACFHSGVTSLII